MTTPQFYLVAIAILLIALLAGALQLFFHRKTKREEMENWTKDLLRTHMTEGIALGYGIMHNHALLGDQDGDLISVLCPTGKPPYPSGRYLIKGETPEIIAADIDLGEAGL